MNSIDNKVLIDALSRKERDYRAAIDRLLSATENDGAAYDAVRELREAVELVGCLRRIVANCNVNQVHLAFGAPGDFGYETPIGDALSRLYHAPTKVAK